MGKKRASSSSGKPRAAAGAGKRKKRLPAAPVEHVIHGDVALAARHGVTTKAVYGWRLAGIPCVKNGRQFDYDAEKTDAWVELHRKRGASDPETEDTTRIKRETLKEKAAQEKLRTRRMEEELAVAEGELLPRRAWELFAATLLTDLGDWCEQLPDLVAGQCCKGCRDKIAARLKTELDNRRNDLADDLTRGPQPNA